MSAHIYLCITISQDPLTADNWQLLKLAQAEGEKEGIQAVLPGQKRDQEPWWNCLNCLYVRPSLKTGFPCFEVHIGNMNAPCS